MRAYARENTYKLQGYGAGEEVIAIPKEEGAADWE